MKRVGPTACSLFLCPLIVACTSMEPGTRPGGLPGVEAWAQAIHSDLLGKYTAVEQWDGDDPQVDHSGLVPFEGDCDDYYTAAWNRLSVNGLRPYALIMTNKRDPSRGHVVACTKTDIGRLLCLDPREDRVVTKRYYLGKYFRFVERSMDDESER